MMYLRYLLYTVVWMTAMLSGLFIFPFLPKDGEKLKWKWANAIWGNDVDGIDGDSLYQENQAKTWYRKLWPNWYWSCVRNPANNLLRRYLNADGFIAKIEEVGNWTFVTMMNGRRYFFYYNQGGKYIVKFGWRFWRNEIKVFQHYNATYVFNP